MLEAYHQQEADRLQDSSRPASRCLASFVQPL